MALEDVPLLSGAQGFGGHGREMNRDRIAFLDWVSREAGDVVRLRLATRDVMLVNSPASIHEVLVTKARSFEKSPLMRAALYPLAGEGLFTSGSQLWRRQRRLMAPVFQPAKIDMLAAMMVDCAELACARWQDGAVIDIASETTRIAMSVAGRTLFGIDTFEETDAIGRALNVALGWANNASASLLVMLQVELRLALLGAMAGRPPLRRALTGLIDRLDAPVLWPTQRNRELARAISLLDERVQRMVDERRANPQAKVDLLTHLLAARDEDDGSAMSDKQVRDEILTLFVAGHETTANGLAWSMYLLGRDPGSYARARAAVDALQDRPPTLADIGRLSFLERVFKEALRLYPPIYLFARIAAEDVSIAGYALPERTIVLISPFTVQRRPELWPDPIRFDPDRFSPEAESTRPRGAWIPFSDGPRFCIGAHFALLEAPLVLATLLQHADFELAHDREILTETSATLRPRGGIPMRLRSRVRKHSSIPA